MSWCDCDSTFDFAVVTLTYKILSGLYLGNHKLYLELYITDTALKVFRSLYCFTTSMFHGVENYFSRLWGTAISDALFPTIFGGHLKFLHKKHKAFISEMILDRVISTILHPQGIHSHLALFTKNLLLPFCVICINRKTQSSDNFSKKENVRLNF